jgi:hypothetical protein
MKKIAEIPILKLFFKSKKKRKVDSAVVRRYKKVPTRSYIR